MSAAPGFTLSPERTLMAVMKPSTCGCTLVERRDFTVPTYSVVWGTARSASVTTSTGIGGGPPAPCACRRQAGAASTTSTASAALRFFMSSRA